MESFAWHVVACGAVCGCGGCGHLQRHICVLEAFAAKMLSASESLISSLGKAALPITPREFEPCSYRDV